MRVYRNVSTGVEITVNSEIHGGGWEEVTPAVEPAEKAVKTPKKPTRRKTATKK